MTFMEFIGWFFIYGSSFVAVVTAKRIYLGEYEMIMLLMIIINIYIFNEGIDIVKIEQRIQEDRKR